MTKQPSPESGATTSTGLLSRTVATVSIAYRECARVRAGETSGAMGTVATVCSSSAHKGCHVVAHVRVCGDVRGAGSNDRIPPPAPPVGHTSRLPKWHAERPPASRSMVPSRRKSSGEARGNSHHIKHSFLFMSERPTE